MFNLRKNNLTSKFVTILLVTLISINSILPLMNLSEFNSLNDSNDNNQIEVDPFELKDLNTNSFGFAPWWDHSYEHRRLINITNPYPYSFTDYGVSVSFYYADLIQDGKIQNDLDDIRIVEKGILRSYYIKKDYPSPNFVNIWFDTNISANSIESDTYLYFGNPTANNNEANDPSESFGWIKNGDFELDVNTTSKFIPYGWNFSHNPVDQIKGVSNPYPTESSSSATSYDFFVNKLIDNPQGGERVAQGDYSYKFGALSPTLPDGVVNDYASTFFSYPFTVPTVKDGGKISMSFFRNVRTHRFERPKNMGEINKDGYFIRILNGTSNYVSNPDNHDDTAISPSFQNYIESNDGYAYYNVPAKKWNDPTLLLDFPGHATIIDTMSDSGLDGELTGYINYDITAYMGKKIYFEFGVWGDESNADKKEKSAFFQVDDLGFNYTLSASINEIQDRTSDITISTRDIDGLVLTNVEIFIVNESARGTSNFIVESGVSSSIDGSVTFENILNGAYNITANYTLDGNDYELYNSTKFNQITYNFTGKSYDIDIALDVWTIDFEITDWDSIPLSYGFINVSDEKDGNFLKTLTLDNDGKATFRWKTDPDFYYEVFYDNDDYVGAPFLLNESYIYRSSYLTDRMQSHNIFINETNLKSSSSSQYEIQELVYTDGSQTIFSNKKIIKANITLANMNDQISNVSIYYVDKDNSTGEGDENLILFKDNYDFDSHSDFISLDIAKTNNSKLISESFDVHGLFLIVSGRNNTECNGLVTIDLLESTNIRNVTALSRLDIRVININQLFPEGAPIDSLIKVSDDSSQALVNLTSIAVRDGYSYGQNNGYEIPFWFFRGRTYNFSIDVLNITDVSFNVTYMSPENQWRPISNTGIKNYNYTFYESGSITFNIIFESVLNLTHYDTTFYNSSGTTQATWGEFLNYSIDFYFTDDGGDNWYPITNPSSTCSVEITTPGNDEILLRTIMTSHGNGTFSIAINSSIFSADYSYKYYYISIIGNNPGYPPPNEKTFLVRLNSIPTEMTAHDYETLSEINNNKIIVYFDELINISVRYSILSSGISLEGAILSYVWIGLSPIIISSDPINQGYFTFTIDTFDAQTIGLKIISLTARYENYSQITNYLIYLDILPRLTMINGNEDLEYVNKQIWVQNAHLFNFVYEDLVRSTIIGDLDVATYIWQEVDNFGDIIEGRDGSGTLYENANNTYSLDFETEIKSVGYYLLYITLQKENYEIKSALINMQIKLREFSLDATNIENNQLNTDQGDDLEITINLIDESRDDIQLENATVYLEMLGIRYDFNETSAGEYRFTLKTNNIEAFFMSQIYSAKITIQKDNFTTQEIPISITIKMEEIFPGMPTFYFILIISSIVAVMASAGIYRGVQQARIPKHVKRIRKIKKAIKSKKGITEISIPSKQKIFIKLFGNDWKAIGLSVEDSLNMKEYKLKKNSLEGEER